MIFLKTHWSVENSAYFSSFQHRHWLWSATRKNKWKSNVCLFLLSLNTYGQVCGTRRARYLLCKVLLMEHSSSGWSYNIKVDFVECYLLCWCKRLWKAWMSWLAMCLEVRDMKSSLFTEKQVKGWPYRPLPECINEWEVIVYSFIERHNKMRRSEA